jgi:hypothetical protein
MAMPTSIEDSTLREDLLPSMGEAGDRTTEEMGKEGQMATTTTTTMAMEEATTRMVII